VTLTGSRRAAVEADVAVVGSGLPALLTALELGRRGVSVVVVGDAGARPSARGLGLVLLGPGRPYLAVARAVGRPAAQLVWAAGCENHLRAKAFLDQAARPCGYVARGSFLLARDRREAEELAESEDMLRDDGFPGEFLDHYMLETRFDMTGFPGAYWAAEDAELDPLQLASAIEHAARDARVRFPATRARALRPEASGVVVELEQGSLRAAAAVVATDGPAAGLVPELAPLLRPSATARLSLSPLAGATLPGAVRTADGRIAWQSTGDRFLLAETGSRPPEAREDPLTEFATRLPFDLGSARAIEEAGEVSLDGLPLVGRMAGRPLAVACGFGRLAPGLGFAAARWVADALLRGTDPTPDALRATRAPQAFERPDGSQ
jgi:glycine/D-amino acid oxidase-like deaminating enzyme